MFKSFNNLRIGVRIIIGFFIIVAIACIIGVVGIQILRTFRIHMHLIMKVLSMHWSMLKESVLIFSK